MNSILQGTTPTLSIAIDPADFSVSDVTALELAVRQKDNITLYALSDVTVDPADNSISYQFTEEETLAFTPGVFLSVQLRFWFADGNICGTNRITLNVDDLISSEVVST